MEQKKDYPQIPKYVVWIAAGILGFVVALYVFSYIAAGNPASCSSCHVMKKAYDGWKETAHERFHCQICHQDPTIFVRFLTASRLLGDTYAYITRAYAKDIRVTEEISDDRCLKCHVTWRNVSPSGDLRVSHENHIKKEKIKCVECHSRVSHPYKLRDFYTTRPPMTYCLKCHDGKKATMECKACHTDKPIPDTHRLAGWLQDHGLVSEKERKECANCHAWVLDFCNECHKEKRPASHVGGVEFRSLHGDRAHERPKSCLQVCHSRAYCTTCHDEALFTVRLKGKI